MKLASICPPGGFSSLPYQSGYQMALAQYVLYDPHYVEHMNQHAARNAFIIMDNGVAEGTPVPIDKLISAADLIEPDEIVLPDAMRDAERTLEMHTHTQVMTSIPPMQRMIVLQGSKWSEVKHFLMEIRKMSWFHFASIGVPKHLEGLKGGRARAIKWLVEYGFALRHNIHLLGVYEKPFEEILRAYEAYPGIRGVDTAAPVAYAQHSFRLSDAMHYSLDWHRNFNLEYLRSNIIIYTAFCYKGIDNELKSFRGKLRKLPPGQATIRALEANKII